jgi:uncharacterized protein YjbJ (UPF0337 family)
MRLPNLGLQPMTRFGITPALPRPDAPTSARREAMNEDVFKGQWTQFKGRVREQWGKLTNDDVDRIEGKSEQLVGRLQERYGWAREQAEREVDNWVRAQGPTP